MAPQTSIPLAANILGTIGTICWCIQLIPQIWYNWSRKSTEGLPSSMCFLWAVAGPPFGVYAISQNLNIPIQIQPQIFAALCLVCWAQTLYYQRKWSKLSATLAGLGMAAVFAGSEGLLVFFSRRLYRQGVEWPVTTIGIIAAIVLTVGLVPPYYELWKRGGRVVGINFIFLTLDFAGACFSLLSIAAQNSFDVLGGVSYIACVVPEMGIFASQAIWLYRTRKIRKAAKDVGMTYDQYVAAGSEKSSFNDSAPPSRSSNLDALQYSPASSESLEQTAAANSFASTQQADTSSIPVSSGKDVEKAAFFATSELV